MKKPLYFTLLMLFSLFNLNAAIIDGPANIRNKPNGDILYELENNQYVYANELKNNWFKLTVTAIVQTKDLKNDSLISAGTILYAHDLNTQMGTAKSRLNIADSYIETGNDAYIEVMLFGYTYQTNIQTSSILEREVERILNNSLIEELPSLKERFDFHEHHIEDYYVWTTYDWSSPWMSADFRMMIYFDAQKQVIGIANIVRKLTLEKVKSVSTIDRNYKIQYLVEMEEKQQKYFRDLMTRRFAGRD